MEPSIQTLLETAVQLLIVTIGGFIHGILGFGFPMIPTPLLALVTDVRTAVLHLLLPSIVIYVVSIARGGRWSSSIGRHWPLAVFGIIGAVVGTRLLVQTDPAPYKLLMAATLLLYLNIHRIGLRMDWVRRRPWLAFAVFGFAGGFLAGTVNAQVPPLAIYALEIGLNPTVIVQLFNFCFLTGKIAQVTTFAAGGLFTRSVVLSSLPWCLAALLAVVIGQGVRDRVSESVYRGWVRKALLVIAIMLVAQYGLSHWLA
ncbi:MAG: sulfite exporter TauE/SafE family protein [Desulfobacterales bacterium]